MGLASHSHVNNKEPISTIEEGGLNTKNLYAASKSNFLSRSLAEDTKS